MTLDTIGEINYFSHTIDGSYPMMDANPKLGWTSSNYVQIPIQMTIHDLRDNENIVDFDTNGFELLKYTGHIHDPFDDNSEEQRLYYEDLMTALKNRLGASRVLISNHVIRYRGPPRPADLCDPTHKNPVFYPHVDNDPRSAHCKVKEMLGEEEGEKAMKNRFQLINVWRPLGSSPILNTPLTICDYRSLDLDNDVHVSGIRASESTVSIYMISRNIHDAHEWYYLSKMKSDEMFIFKIFDSNPDVAQFGAHTAFRNDNAPSMIVEQCSIETRCLVLYDQ